MRRERAAPDEDVRPLGSRSVLQNHQSTWQEFCCVIGRSHRRGAPENSLSFAGRRSPLSMLCKKSPALFHVCMYECMKVHVSLNEQMMKEQNRGATTMHIFYILMYVVHMNVYMTYRRYMHS